MQEIRLDGKGNIKLRDTIFTHKEIKQRDKTFTQGTKVQNTYGATWISTRTRTLTLEWITIPPLSISVTLGLKSSNLSELQFCYVQK